MTGSRSSLVRAANHRKFEAESRLPPSHAMAMTRITEEAMLPESWREASCFVCGIRRPYSDRMKSVCPTYAILSSSTSSEVERLRQQLPAHERAQAADAIATEAHWRVQNPIYGCTEIIARLQNQITTAQNELAVIQARITIHKAHMQPLDQAQGNYDVVAAREGAHSYLKDNDFLLPQLSNLPLDFC
ncbi:LOB domain-containing protein 12 [Dendrobium catenatum]|uniref:LOB domain-containing protein 12 n=1 Tax=Dendrobium catenatum TaxID=906689 RepID=A0A2I0W0U9_9ASPA|nr:LOB domain-containing protein 12 [Dendrobium catenatum]